MSKGGSGSIDKLFIYLFTQYLFIYFMKQSHRTSLSPGVSLHSVGGRCTQASDQLLKAVIQSFLTN